MAQPEKATQQMACQPQQWEDAFDIQQHTLVTTTHWVSPQETLLPPRFRALSHTGGVSRSQHTSRMTRPLTNTGRGILPEKHCTQLHKHEETKTDQHEHECGCSATVSQEGTTRWSDTGCSLTVQLKMAVIPPKIQCSRQSGSVHNWQVTLHTIWPAISFIGWPHSIIHHTGLAVGDPVLVTLCSVFPSLCVPSVSAGNLATSPVPGTVSHHTPHIASQPPQKQSCRNLPQVLSTHNPPPITTP
jgi:hypothetical protein